MTNAALLFGKNKVFIVDYFAELDPFGLEDNLYIVRLANDGTENHHMYEWKNGAYQPFSFKLEVPPVADAAASIEVYKKRADLPAIHLAKENVLYVVLEDITAERKTTMYLFTDGVYTLLAAFSADGSIQEYTQVTKLGVEASTSAPKSYEITIPRATNFLRAPIEVLKFLQVDTNIVQTVMDFTNGEASDFEENEHVIFDGVMKLRMEKSLPLEETVIDSVTTPLYRAIVNQRDYKSLARLVNSAGKALLHFNGAYYSIAEAEWFRVDEIDEEAFVVYGMALNSSLEIKSVQGATILFDENVARINLHDYKNIEKIEVVVTEQ